MEEDKYTVSSGMLSVGNGHKIYYQQWGNKEAVPIFVLHGGPGYCSQDKHKLTFDPKIHHVIFHDQRGNGKSEYESQLKDVNIQNLASDIEKLRKHLKFEKINIFGNSWGSTLGLYYAIQHTDRVNKMMLGGIYTGSDKETSYLFKGGLGNFFPEAWKRFSELVPIGEIDNIFDFYENVLTSGSVKRRLEHYKRWLQLESSAMTFDNDYKKLRLDIDSRESLEGIESDLLSIHYFKNNCFLPDKYILKNVNKLSGLPTVITQGRYDMVCLPAIAYKVAEDIGESCHLHIVPANHRVEASLREIQRAYAWSFLG